MATLTEIQEKLALFAEQAVYPNGLSNPSVVDKDVSIVIGFPLKEDLDKALIDDHPIISIFSDKQVESNVTRFLRKQYEISVETPSISLDVSGNEVSVNGVPKEGERATITVKTAFSEIYYSYLVSATDSLDDIAFNLGSLIPSASVLANVITIADAIFLEANVVVQGLLGKEIKRQKKAFLIICWTSTVEDRTILGDVLDLYFSNIYRFDVSDGSALMVYDHTYEEDHIQKHKSYRRYLCYRVEYPTVLKSEASTVSETEVDIIVNE
jgi:hypothetical protein